MAIIHISEAEAARDLPGLLALVRAGEEVRIGNDTTTVAMRKLSSEDRQKKTLSEAIRLAEERALTVTLDDKWSDDLDIVISNHEHEGIRDLWEE